jgi:hypothetical protein
MNSNGRGEIFSLSNTLLQKFLGRAPNTVLNILFCGVNVFLMVDDLALKIIPYFIIK